MIQYDIVVQCGTRYCYMCSDGPETGRSDESVKTPTTRWLSENRYSRLFGVAFTSSKVSDGLVTCFLSGTSGTALFFVFCIFVAEHVARLARAYSLPSIGFQGSLQLTPHFQTKTPVLHTHHRCELVLKDQARRARSGKARKWGSRWRARLQNLKIRSHREQSGKTSPISAK